MCADATLVLYGNLTGRTVSLADYLNKSYALELSHLGQKYGSQAPFPTTQYTTMSDVAVVTRLLLLNAPYLARTVVRSARNMQLGDFKRGNFVMVGGPRAIPWEELFDKHLNFRVELDPERQVRVIRINSPIRGERPQYENVVPKPGQPGGRGKLYSTVALTTNLTCTGYSLLIRGTTGEATEAAADYLTNSASSSRLASTLGVKANSKLTPFEILLESTTLGGNASSTEMVVYRLSQPEEMCR